MKNEFRVGDKVVYRTNTTYGGVIKHINPGYKIEWGPFGGYPGFTYSSEPEELVLIIDPVDILKRML